MYLIRLSYCFDNCTTKISSTRTVVNVPVVIEVANLVVLGSGGDDDGVPPLDHELVHPQVV